MKLKKGFFDRIGQSFSFLFSNFRQSIHIFGALFFYKFIFIFIFGNVLYYIFLYSVDFNGIFDKFELSNIFTDILGNNQIIIWENIYTVYVLLNIIFIIPFTLATLKIIREYYHSTVNINFWKNLKYGFQIIGESFKTYWFMFIYVAFIPLIFLIIGLLAILLGEYSNIDNVLKIGFIITGISIFLLIVFGVYRGLRTSFSIVHAIDRNTFDENNFEQSLYLTDNNWGRIFGNLLFLGIIIIFISGIFSQILSIYTVGIFEGIDIDSLVLNYIINGSITKTELHLLFKEIYSNITTFHFINILFEFLKFIFTTFLEVFSLVFLFLFFKRIESEKKHK